MMMDIDISEAMLCYNLPFENISAINGIDNNGKDWLQAKVIRHPDTAHLSDQFSHSVGSCFADFKQMDEYKQLFKLLIEAWHAAAFDHVPIEFLHKAMLVIPQYRDMLASDALPKEFQHERV